LEDSLDISTFLRVDHTIIAGLELLEDLEVFDVQACEVLEGFHDGCLGGLIVEGKGDGTEVWGWVFSLWWWEEEEEGMTPLSCLLLHTGVGFSPSGTLRL